MIPVDLNAQCIGLYMIVICEVLAYVFDFEGLSDLLILFGPKNLGDVILHVDQE